jgi:hypothetical protein
MPSVSSHAPAVKSRATNFPETLRVRAASRGGSTAAAYVVAAGVATLIHRTEPRGVLRARAFGWGRGGRRG